MRQYPGWVPEGGSDKAEGVFEGVIPVWIENSWEEHSGRMMTTRKLLLLLMWLQ